MKKLCFYNMYHIGDIIFGIPFIRNICEKNKHLNIYIYTLYGKALYENIKNLLFLDSDYKNEYLPGYIPGDHPENYIEKNNQLFKIFLDNQNTKYFELNFNGVDYICINFWCVALKFNNYYKDICFDFLKEAFDLRINEINNKYSLGLILENISNENILNDYDEQNIDYFLKWYSNEIVNKNIKIIFLFNFTARSGQYSYDKKDIFMKIISKYQNIFFIFPIYDAEYKNFKNVKFCDVDFKFHIRPDCRNLLQINQVLSICDLIFSVPVGAAWIYINKNIYKYKTDTIFIIDISNSYSYRLNKWIKDTSKNKSIKNILYTDIEKIIHTNS